MSKFTNVMMVAAGLMSASMFAIGCKSSTEPQSQQAYDSEAAADLSATALGNQSAGLGMALGDSYSLATNGSIPRSGMDDKGNPILSSDSSYDPATGWHTVTVNKSITNSNFNFSKTVAFIYQYQLIDTTGAFEAKWKKGLTNTINVKLSVIRNKAIGSRLVVDDSASGNWTMTGLANFTTNPTFTGSYTRSGADTLLTADNNLRTLEHTMTISFNNDTLVRLIQGNDRFFFLDGTATSDLTAINGKGVSFKRHIDITFNGNGTATLLVTRTSGDGSTDTFTVDIIVGMFRRWGR